MGTVPKPTGLRKSGCSKLGSDPGYDPDMPSGVLSRRLANQGLAPTWHATPEAAVAWLGAVQAQDYVGAAWALALRVPGLALADVDAALADGRLLRTHVLRPTWHFVSPADIRWMLALTGPRVKALMRGYDARLDLDARVYARARTVFTRALAGGRSLTRPELAGALKVARIQAAGQRLAHLVMDAELAGVLCSGPKRGLQMTYALLDERAPAVKPIARDDALATLAQRYFQSHGPATVHDFAWWSGLTVGDARQAVVLGKVDTAVLTTPPASDRAAGRHYLLPNYDEYLIAYRDRGVAIDPERARNLGTFTSAEYPHQVVLHGRVAGSWRREIDRRGAGVRLQLYAAPATAERRALATAASRFGRFLGLPCTVRD